MLWKWRERRSPERRLAATLELMAVKDAGRELGSDRRIRLLIGLARELEACDPYTHGHSRRVARHAAVIAQAMGLSREQITKVRAAAALHDVGKINTPRSVLYKPGRLTEAERGVIRRHPVDGAEMVALIGDPELTAMVRHHHERLDGTGYPDKLVGTEIPLGARIIAIADTYDAITSTRSYRPANAHREALEILDEEAGRRLDAAGVSAFRAYHDVRLTPRWGQAAASGRRTGTSPLLPPACSPSASPRSGRRS